MLTVQNAIAYENISSPNESGSQPMLSCVPGERIHLDHSILMHCHINAIFFQYLK